MYEDAELEALLDQDTCQTQEKIAESLGMTQQAISHRLASLGMIQNKANPYELKPRNIKLRFSACEMQAAFQNSMIQCLVFNAMIHKQGNWVPYELKPRNIERRFSTSEMLLARHKRKNFLHRIVTGDEKWIHYDNPL